MHVERVSQYPQMIRVATRGRSKAQGYTGKIKSDLGSFLYYRPQEGTYHVISHISI